MYRRSKCVESLVSWAEGPAAAPILDELRRLEYRRYDSAGMGPRDDRAVVRTPYSRRSSETISAGGLGKMFVARIPGGSDAVCRPFWIAQIAACVRF
jgi:hypothetical protein